ncbi:uncharacterized protein LODBEIA_P52370 [Lodderomyces beijingensis]|uniref:intramembrane prenyl-peptidase Rce1 n=1 Tax=Lodderomyces beijingensis TaxID=1775926 RepID=A0ABP0ZTM2_9ASCO
MIYELLVLAIAASYVLAIYALQPAEITHKDRNDPKVITHRFKRVGSLCLVLLLVTPFCVKGTFPGNVRSIGLIPGFTDTFDFAVDAWNLWNAVSFICIVFSSAIFQWLEGDDPCGDHSQFVRDYLFAPITEELLYRGLILLVVRRECPAFLPFTPFLFAFAHLHHGWRMHVAGVPILSILATTGFQFAYTSLFGYLANSIYLKSCNLWSAIIVHSGCNFFGFPSFAIESNHLWTKVVYYGLLVIGFARLYRECVA